MNTRLLWLAAMAGGLVCAHAKALDFPVNHAVPDEQLDRIRGGFDLGDNLVASFALERTVLVNGVEALRTSVSVPDVAAMTQDQAAALQSALQTTVITNGVGGVASETTAVLPSSATPGLIIQNSLDNQAITANTTIDASVNTAQMLQNMRVAESVKDAVIQFRGN